MKVQSQDPTWTKTYGTALNDAGYSIAKTYDGGYIVGGTTTADNGNKDILLLKLNNEGDTLWSKTFGGTFNDESFCVKQCRDSGFVIAGYKATGSSNMDFYIIKTDASGNQQWNRTYGGALNEGSYSIIQTLDDGFAVCGYTGTVGAGAKDMLLLKYENNGDLQWQQTYGGSFDEIAYSLIQTSDSGYVLTGTSKSFNNSTLNDIYCVRTNNVGDTLWTKDYQMDGNEIAQSITATNGNYYLIAGKAQTTTNNYYQPFALKINQEGNIIFNQIYNLGTNVEGAAYYVKEMPDLSYMLVGSIADSTYGSGSDVLMLKIGEWGDTLDTQIYGTQYNDEARSFCIDDNENIVLVGKSFNPTTLNDIGVIAYPACRRYFPRYIWVNNVYNNGQAASNILDPVNGINWSRLIDLGTYLSTLKYSGIVITHTEDLYKGSTADIAALNQQMTTLLTQLHLWGIPVILSQFRGAEKIVGPNASYNNMVDYLNATTAFNYANNLLGNNCIGCFDGLELDYEFWQKGYGGNNDYSSIETGFVKYKNLASLFLNTKASPAFHLKKLAMWVGSIFVFENSYNWDVDMDGTPNTVADNISLMTSLDSLQFDRFVLSYFLDDKLPSTSAYHDPLNFLKRPPLPSSNKANSLMSRLYYLGQNTYPTNVIPQFHSGSVDDDDNPPIPQLERYLEGTGYWAPTPHYLYQPEEEFISQYFNPYIFDEQNPPGITTITDKAWHTSNIFLGFEWFRYQIGPLEMAQLPSRLADARKAQYNCIANPLRISTSYTLSSNSTNQNSDLKLEIAPQPLVNKGTLKINQLFENPALLTLQCYDAMGSSLTNVMQVAGVSVIDNQTIMQLRSAQKYSGILVVKVLYNQQYAGAVKVLILNN